MRFMAILLALQQSPFPVGRARPRPPFDAQNYKLESTLTAGLRASPAGDQAPCHRHLHLIPD
jgi:hypothetical protein